MLTGLPSVALHQSRSIPLDTLVEIATGAPADGEKNIYVWFKKQIQFGNS